MVKRVAALLIFCALVLLVSALVVEYYFPVQTTENISLYAAIIVIVVVLVVGYLLRKTTHTAIRLILLGITLVFLGAIMLIYGNNYSNPIYWIIGLCCVVIGSIFWILGNDMVGAFDERVAGIMEPIKEPEEYKKMKKEGSG